MKYLLIAIVICFRFIYNCSAESETIIPSCNLNTSADSSLPDLSKRILELIKNEEYFKLGKLFHPIEGVRFSPYGYIDTVNDRVFSKQYFMDCFSRLKPKYYFWGYMDGTGDSIYLPIKEYFKRFVYDVDFLNAEKLSLNNCLGHSNTANNIETVYPGLEYTESYFSGFEVKFNGMDWRALRFVFKEYNGKNYLIAIIHDEWTI
ncbi:MAG: hypothetical protein IT280_06535 [Ignavibacteria bacterium]|nr:hypothetical protein [Ignavibacteria bacterium]